MPAPHRPLLTLLAVPVLWTGLVLAAQERGATPPTNWPVTFVDVASQAGLTTPSVYGGIARKRFIIETNGAGVALLDVDGDGWLDALVLNGTRLKEGSRDDQVWPVGESPTARLYRNRRDAFRSEDQRQRQSGARPTRCVARSMASKRFGRY